MHLQCPNVSNLGHAEQSKTIYLKNRKSHLKIKLVNSKYYLENGGTGEAFPDCDVLAWFRARRKKGYQTAINAVLRAFMESQERGKRP